MLALETPSPCSSRLHDDQLLCLIPLSPRDRSVLGTDTKADSPRDAPNSSSLQGRGDTRMAETSASDSPPSSHDDAQTTETTSSDSVSSSHELECGGPDPFAEDLSQDENSVADNEVLKSSRHDAFAEDVSQDGDRIGGKEVVVGDPGHGRFGSCPNEIKLAIFGYLEICHLFKAQRVSKGWREILLDPFCVRNSLQ